MNKTNKIICSTNKSTRVCANTMCIKKILLQTGSAYQELSTPTKSESDKKIYKVIQLNNGLTACLISDMNGPKPELYGNEEQMEKSESESEEESSASEGEFSESEGSESENSLEGADEDYDSRKAKSKHSKSTDQKMAAAALCIGVGSFSDPKDIPGMAHFLEHMVFMGSEKYPKENAFDEFIKQTGGSNNASTDAETTVFYFECLDEELNEALDIFSQFFISPLMKKEAIEREREAIESEFQMTITSDSSRKEQLLCSMAKHNSPVNSFAWGNLVTLRDNVNDDELYKKVHEFRKRHYSAHRMTLVVQARLPVEELCKYVVDRFSSIPNNNLPTEDYSEFFGNVFDTEEFNKIYHMIPVKDLCQVDITWALPSLKNKYKTKPHYYISHLLGDEGIGSLLSYLKKKYWVIGTTIGTGDSGSEHNSLFTLFTVSLNLTQEGYNHISYVIETVFSYIKMLQNLGPQKTIFEELQAISEMGFKYMQEESPVDLVENLCEEMQFYPPQDYITGDQLYFEYDPEAINTLLCLMTPEKANYLLLKRPEGCAETYQREKWFGSKFKVENIPDCWMTQWRNAPLNPELSIPPPNSFITTDFTILPIITDCIPEYPSKILDSPLLELWYRRDVTFKLPTAYYYLYLISPIALGNPKNTCMLDTLVNLLTIDIAEEIYPALTADLSYSFSTYDKGLVIKVWSFNEKLPILINLIAKYLINLENRITENMFEAIKDKLLKNYYNKLLKPGGLSRDIRINLLVDNNWLPLDRYLAMLDVSFDDIKKYTKDFIKTLYVKALVQGNCSSDTAIKTVNDFVQKLNYQELKKEDIPKFRVIRVDQGEVCCRVNNFNISDTNSIITNYYQSDHYTVKNSVILDIIMMVIEEPLFDVLRTKEQLGYHVTSSVRHTFGVLGFTVTVNAQATKSTVKFVDERIEAFLKQSQSILQNLDNNAFQKFKTNLIKTKQICDIHLKEEVDRNWDEIVNDDYVFDRIKQEIEAIKNTNKEEVLKWWEAHNSFGSKENFRKISIQIQGSMGNIPEEKSSQEDPSKLKINCLGDEQEAKARGNSSYFIASIQDYKINKNIFNVK